MKPVAFFLLTFSLQTSFAQNENSKKLSFDAYGEIYYSYDFSRPSNHEKAGFLYNHKRHNELNANLLMLSASYSDRKSRANLGVMAGNYAQYNLIAEPNFAQFIYEANIGIKVSNNRNIWLDAGILPSHIGFESAIGAECWTLTRSVHAENSPYFETGVKLSYVSKNEKLNLGVLYLNGWQRLRKPDGIQRPSFGTQINITPSEKITLNFSSFIGTDKPDSINATRLFHDFYFQFQPSKNFGIIAGFDIGRDKAGTGIYGTWWAPVFIIRQGITQKTSLSLRGEYFHDPEQIIVSTGTIHGFQNLGMSANLDYDLNEKIKWRIEGKTYRSKDKIFNESNSNYAVTSSLSLKL